MAAWQKMVFAMVWLEPYKSMSFPTILLWKYFHNKSLVKKCRRFFETGFKFEMETGHADLHLLNDY